MTFFPLHFPSEGGGSPYIRAYTVITEPP